MMLPRLDSPDSLKVRFAPLHAIENSNAILLSPYLKLPIQVAAAVHYYDAFGRELLAKARLKGRSEGLIRKWRHFAQNCVATGFNAKVRKLGRQLAEIHRKQRPHVSAERGI
jgi:hypothetical protein